jgi:hypothetical protein
MIVSLFPPPARGRVEPRRRAKRGSGAADVELFAPAARFARQRERRSEAGWGSRRATLTPHPARRSRRSPPSPKGEGKKKDAR